MTHDFKTLRDRLELEFADWSATDLAAGTFAMTQAAALFFSFQRAI